MPLATRQAGVAVPKVPLATLTVPKVPLATRQAGVAVSKCPSRRPCLGDPDGVPVQVEVVPRGGGHAGTHLGRTSARP
jgi:hypothetical protein